MKAAANQSPGQDNQRQGLGKREKEKHKIENAAYFTL